MDLFSKLEQALEGMVEGVFSRAFRTQLQPIEVAKRLTRAVENHRTVSVHATYVPNVYTVHLAPETHASFQSISGHLLSELEQYLREYTAEHDYETVGALVVTLEADEAVKPNDVVITAVNEESAVPSAAPAPATFRSYPTSVARPPRKATTAEIDQTMFISAPPPTALEVVAGEGVGQRIPLRDTLTIGRGPSNEIALAEAGVSRNHAVINWQEERWILRDQGSTNGTYVNARRITAHTLSTGDRIQIGQTVFQVK